MSPEPALSPDASPDQGKPKEPETVTLSKSQYEAMQRENQELRQSERAWSEMARRGAPAPAEPAPEPEPEVSYQFEPPQPDAPNFDSEKPEVFIDDLSSTGVKALVKRGVLTEKAATEIFDKRYVPAMVKLAEQVVQKHVSRLTSDAKLFNDFPELKEKDSEFVRETAKHYNELTALDPVYGKKTNIAIHAAAQIARATLAAETAARKRKPQDEDMYEDESSRKLRAASQDGITKRGSVGDEEDSTVGPEARQLLRQMNAAGGGGPKVSEQAFLEAKKRMGIRSRR